MRKLKYAGDSNNGLVNILKCPQKINVKTRRARLRKVSTHARKGMNMNKDGRKLSRKLKRSELRERKRLWKSG